LPTPQSELAAYLSSIEWVVLTGFIAVLGWPLEKIRMVPLLMFFGTFLVAMSYMIHARIESKFDTIPARLLVAFLASIVILLIAAKLVSLSGRLPRPLPRIAPEFVLPRAALLGLVGSGALAPFAGWPRFTAIALAAAIALLFAMQGLATAHVLVARIPARPLILGAGYAMIFVVEPWTFLGFAVLGLIDMALSLRARSLARSAVRPPAK